MKVLNKRIISSDKIFVISSSQDTILHSNVNNISFNIYKYNPNNVIAQIIAYDKNTKLILEKKQALNDTLKNIKTCYSDIIDNIKDIEFFYYDNIYKYNYASKGKSDDDIEKDIMQSINDTSQTIEQTLTKVNESFPTLYSTQYRSNEYSVGNVTYYTINTTNPNADQFNILRKIRFEPLPKLIEIQKKCLYSASKINKELLKLIGNNEAYKYLLNEQISYDEFLKKNKK